MSEISHRTYADGTPVSPLYTEGPQTNAPFRKEPWWVMTQEHLVDKEFRANDWALERLNHGASGLLFYLSEEHYLPRILRDIQLPYINLGLVVEGSGPAVMEALLHHAHAEIIPVEKLRGYINIDPVEIAARTGIWHEEKMYELGELSRLTPPEFKYMCCNANFYGACGASAATQLGLAAAHLDFYLENFGSVGFKQYWVALTAGTHLFEEMAKVRALRLIWNKLLQEYELPEVPLEVYVETSTTHQTLFDVHSNLLRATSSAFGAIVGGADQLQIRPFNSALVWADPEGERLALNQHFILAYESHLDRVEDPAAGAYFVETKTEELVLEGLRYLEDLRSQGGIIEALKNGSVQDKIYNEVSKAQPEKILGVNLYDLNEEVLPEGVVVAEPVSRASHQKKHSDKEFEPLRPIRWAAQAEYDRSMKANKK
jgi:methylmalonyl-CoA mutase